MCCVPVTVLQLEAVVMCELYIIWEFKLSVYHGHIFCEMCSRIYESMSFLHTVVGLAMLPLSRLRCPVGHALSLLVSAYR